MIYMFKVSILELQDDIDVMSVIGWFFCIQAEDGIRDLVRSRGLGDVYKRQDQVGALGLPSSKCVQVSIGQFG